MSSELHSVANLAEGMVDQTAVQSALLTVVSLELNSVANLVILTAVLMGSLLVGMSATDLAVSTVRMLVD